MYRMYGMPRAQDAQERQAHLEELTHKIPRCTRDDKLIFD